MQMSGVMTVDTRFCQSLRQMLDKIGFDMVVKEGVMDSVYGLEEQGLCLRWTLRRADAEKMEYSWRIEEVGDACV